MRTYNKKFLIAATFILIAFALNFQHRINYDEGMVLNGAWNLYNGKTLYKDFFEFIGPAALYPVYAIFLLFSPTYFNALIFSILFLLLSSYYIYKIVKLLIVDEFWPYIASLGWIVVASVSYPLINHNTYSSFLAIIFLYYFLLFIQYKKNWLSFLSGSLAALIFYFLQTKGVAIAFASVIFLAFLIYKKYLYTKNILPFFSGYALIFFAGFFAWGINPITDPLTVGSGYIEITYYTISLTPFFLFLIVFLCILLLLIRKKLLNAKIGLIIIMQFFLLLSILNNPDTWHVYTNSFCAIILLIILLRTIFLQLNIFIKKFIFAPATCAILLYMLIYTPIGHYNHSLFISNGLQKIKDVVGEEKIYTFPFAPNLYFELQKNNPYYSSNLIEKNSPPKHFEKNLAILKNENPKFIITDYSTVKKYRHSYKNIIDEYIRENYKENSTISTITIWEWR